MFLPKLCGSCAGRNKKTRHLCSRAIGAAISSFRGPAVSWSVRHSRTPGAGQGVCAFATAKQRNPTAATAAGRSLIIPRFPVGQFCQPHSDAFSFLQQPVARCATRRFAFFAMLHFTHLRPPTKDSEGRHLDHSRRPTYPIINYLLVASWR